MYVRTMFLWYKLDSRFVISEEMKRKRGLVLVVTFSVNYWLNLFICL